MLQKEYKSPDKVETEFIERRGEFSTYSDEAFDKHLRNLARHKENGSPIKLWYGWRNVPINR